MNKTYKENKKNTKIVKKKCIIKKDSKLNKQKEDQIFEEYFHPKNKIFHYGDDLEEQKGKKNHSKLMNNVNDISLEEIKPELVKLLSKLKTNYKKHKKFLSQYYSKVFSSTKNNELYINDAPTGLGKTHYIAEYIVSIFLYEKIVNKNDKKIFYMTDLRNNTIPLYKKVCKLINKNCNKNNISEKSRNYLLSKIRFLYPMSNKGILEMLFDLTDKEALSYLTSSININNVNMNENNKIIINFLEYCIDLENNNKNKTLLKNLGNLLKVINNFNKYSQEFEKMGVISEKQEKIQIETSMVLKRIRELIRNNYNKISQDRFNKKLAHLFLDGEEVSKNSEDDAWVFFGTTSKFDNPLNCVNGSFNFFDKIANQIIIIDEFDTQYSVLKNNSIEKSIGNELDLYETIKKLISLFSDNKYAIEEEYGGEKIEEKRIEFINKKIIPFKKKINTKYKLVLKHLDNKTTNKTLFNDNITNSFIDDDEIITFKSDDSKHLNHIKIFDKTSFVQDKNEILLKECILELINLLNDFAYFIWDCVSIYDKNNKNGRNFSNESKIWHLLNNMAMGDEELVKYIHTYELKYDNFQKNNNYSEGLPYSLINTPTEIITLEEDEEKGQIKLNYNKNSREANTVLLTLVQKNLVLGISATAQSKSVTNNFNFDFLIKYNVNAIFFSKAEEKQLAAELEEKNKIFKNKVHYRIQTIEKLNNGLSNNSRIINSVNKDHETNDNLDDDELGNQKIGNCINDFFKRKNSKILLILQTKHPSSTKYPNSAKYIDNIFNSLKIKNKDNLTIFPSTKSGCQRFDASYLERHGLKEINEILNKSVENKVVIVTSYNTCGAGVNLQANVGSKNIEDVLKNHVKLDDFNQKEYDIDSVALFLPTNVTYVSPNEKEDIKEKKITKNKRHQFSETSANKSLLESGYLYQSNDKNDKSSYGYCANQIKDRNRVNNLKKEYADNIVDYVYSIAAIIKQAVGRLNRTSIRNSEINIYIEDRLVEKLAHNNIIKNKKDYDTYDYKKIIEYVEKQTNKPKTYNDLIRLNNNNLNINERMKIAINKHLKDIYNYKENKNDNDLMQRKFAKSVSCWHELRRTILETGPFVSLEELELYNNLGFKNIFYHSTEPVSSFNLTNALNGLNNNFTINEEYFKLDYIKNNPILKKFFEDNNYALSFKKEKLIICHEACQAIYKGAIGEEIGKCYFEHEGIKITERLDEKFEVADFFYEAFDENGNRKHIVGIDMKHYSSAQKIEYDEKLLEKSEKKINNDPNFKLIIANAFLLPTSKKRIEFGNIVNKKFIPVDLTNQGAIMKSKVCIINGLFEKDGNIINYDNDKILDFINNL